MKEIQIIKDILKEFSIHNKGLTLMTNPTGSGSPMRLQSLLQMS